LRLHGAPHQRVVYQVVTVDQNVSKGDDLWVLSDALGTGRVELRQPFDCLADDLEIAFHGLTQQPIGAVLRQRAAFAITSPMKAAASRMSSSSFGDRACIQGPPGAVDRGDEVRIDHRAGHHQVDLAA
jgi:hypothetical protein